MPKIIDLTGQRFGRLTVLNKTEKRCGHNIVWHCKCECGNECDINGGDIRQGKTKSCGCLKKEKTAEIGKKYGGKKQKEDITGQKFNRLTALDYDSEREKWRCLCDCGNYVYVRANDLKSNNTQSCGCLKKEKTSELGKTMKEDLTGLTFGRLTVIEDTKIRQNSKPVWKCLCECGSITYVTSSNLKNGTQSCGCLLSKGEEKISNILKENNIFFEKQKKFKTCIFPDTQKYAKFDFFVDNQYLIEFDGIQHFKNDKGWNTLEKFQKTIQRDKYKNQWCKENNIPLIRIPYTKLLTLNIEDLKLETSKFII
jgi:hypothetical protein